jgi:uncharacterized membrane protein
MSAAATSTPPATIARPRVQSVDILRGLVMIVMALDHVRDFLHYGAQHFDPEDLTQTTPVLFFTRWITHFCAPTFVFLAGTGAYLQARRGKSKAEVARFLATRGLWLVVLENTWVLCLGWDFNFRYDQINLWVIWVLGDSMILLAVLIYLPWRALLIGSLAMIFLHNALDAIHAEQFGSMGWLWMILHERNRFFIGSLSVRASYPLIPWVAVMAAGFCFGRVMDLEPERRRRILIRLGLGMVGGFILLRGLNVYGDPNLWAAQSSPAMTIVSFLNTTKYPPSLLYLLMTLGPGILLLGLMERVQLPASNPLIVFGRVPLIYYLLHLPLIHGVALALAWQRYGRIDFAFNATRPLAGPPGVYPPGYGYSLGVVYLIWIAVVVALYPVCRWMARLKQRNRSVVLSYL